MNLSLQNTDGLANSDMLSKLLREIESPLASIIEEFTKSENKEVKEVAKNQMIFTHSLEIKRIVDEVVKKANGTTYEDLVFFQVYNSNERVQSMCKEEVNTQKISKQDISWLQSMEQEVYKNIKHKDLNLYDLSFKLSVSERQLHRKIKNLVKLTPNKYIRILKLHKAKDLIDSYLYDTVSQISYAVGYYDTHYFSKLFNQQYGMYPKELLKSREL
ncbi:helix-turn-helix protein [Tenacibaculum skagerrakense]|uniref:Helix-turn-helix protein n=1 Tax=Tenacibaculum skagerrakense TaxID=186571 RepID=A0A4R2NQQ4_9FLAO|nr:helix-turn-helix transcriptional regulator [Tenacibaculum skagerrakense]TCP24012.1 helix-turn-helix protein [Tenacibaculum skagerrakense]